MICSFLTKISLENLSIENKRKLSNKNKNTFLRVIWTFLNKNEEETFPFKNKKKVVN